ncbi:MAG: amidohydrolase [Planctomycetes bacterium]|nr:amidohydrolase [Planctomycetota bacterium]
MSWIGFCVWAVLLPVVALASNAGSQTAPGNSLAAKIDQLAAEIQPQAIAWRRDIHRHPELSNREVRTAGIVADHLRRLGLEVRTQVAHTGVVAVLRGGQTGPVVALRADMDALPVTEALDVPFASKVKAEYNGRLVGVMHACGHDVHTAVLMAVAQVLAQVREELPGTVKFLFQPAEEGTPQGEQGGAKLMIQEGTLENPKPRVIFALHVNPSYAVGEMAYRPGATMANQDNLRILVRGRQTHGALPWGGTDPIVVASQIVLGLQTIVSRQVDLPLAPAVITIGSIHGGVRSNIIPDEVEMIGTIRTLEPQMRADIFDRIRKTAALIAQSGGAGADVTIDPGYPVTFNDPNLTARMVPVLETVVGKGHAVVMPPMTGAEDFSYYQQQIPGLYFFLGVTPHGTDPKKAPMPHSPRFFADERALVLGIRSLAHLTVSYLEK